jgi:trimeric autotransporter adhesin
MLSPGVSATVGLPPLSSLATQLPANMLSSGSSAHDSAAESPQGPTFAAPAADTAAAGMVIDAPTATTAQREASEEATVAVVLAAAAAQSAGQQPHMQPMSDDRDEDKRSVDSLVLPGEADLPSVAGASSVASDAEGGGMPESPAGSTTAEAGSVVLTAAASEASAGARGSPSKRLLPQPPSAAASPVAGAQPLPLLPPVRPLHYRRLDPLTQTGPVPLQQQPPPVAVLTQQGPVSTVAGDEAVDVLIGDNISAQPPHRVAEPAHPSVPESPQPAAAKAELVAPEPADAAGAQPHASSPPSSSNGFGSFIRSRNVIGRVAEKLHLGSRTSSGGGFGSGGRLYPPPDMEAQVQLPPQQPHSGGNLRPQPNLPSAEDQRQTQAAPPVQPGAPAGRRSDQQQMFRGTSQVLTSPIHHASTCRHASPRIDS